MPYAAFTDFWQRMATHFAGHPGFYGYSLDNEPHDTGGLWVNGGAQAGINGIRMADLTAPILVPGDGWSGAWSWLANGNDALRTLTDPAHNLIFDAHQYFDGDSSGHYAQTYDAQGAYPTLGVDRLTAFVTWLHTYSLRGIITEYAVPDDDPRWLTLLDNALAYLQANSDVIMGGTDWSAGPWWHDYRLSVEPTGTWPNVTDRPQMSVLAARTGCATACTITFTDVDQTNPFYPFIRCLACRGIVSGYADGTFRWGNNVTRGQLAKILANAAGLSDAIPSTQQTFEDVPPSNAFWLWIERLAGHGAISGYACGGPGEPCDRRSNRPYFRRGANATRGQIAKIAALAAGITDPIPTTQQTFADVPAQQPVLAVDRAVGRAGRDQRLRLRRARASRACRRATGPTSAGAPTPPAARWPRSPPRPSSPTARRRTSGRPALAGGTGEASAPTGLASPGGVTQDECNLGTANTDNQAERSPCFTCWNASQRAVGSVKHQR